MSAPPVRSTEALLAQMQRRIQVLERRLATAGSSGGGGGGGGGVWGGRDAGPIGEVSRVDLTSPWTTWGRNNNNAGYGTQVTATRHPSGIVTLDGLVIPQSTPPASSKIGQIVNENCWPAYRVIMPTSVGKAFYVEPTGAIHAMESGFAAGQFYTLNTGYWAADKEDGWIPVGEQGSAFGPNFGSTVDWNTRYGPPSWRVDDYGCTWFRGLVRVNATTSVDNTLMFTLPAYANAAPSETHHIAVAAQSAFGLIGADSAIGICWKTGGSGAVGAWYSLGGVCVVTPSGLTGWDSPPAWINGWGQFSVAAFTQVSWRRRADGIAQLRGLMSGGNLTQRAFNMVEAGTMPMLHMVMFATAAGNLAARLDLRGANHGVDADQGALVPQTGSTSWFSLDSQFWNPYAPY